MSIINKLKSDGELSPKERTEKFGEGINKLAKELGCVLEVSHRIDIVPIEPKKTKKEQDQENFEKA